MIPPPFDWLVPLAAAPFVGKANFECAALLHAKYGNPLSTRFVDQFHESVVKLPGSIPARELLGESDLVAGDIAIACGYASRRAFTRAFTREHGASPETWRQQARAGLLRTTS